MDGFRAGTVAREIQMLMKKTDTSIKSSWLYSMNANIRSRSSQVFFVHFEPPFPVASNGKVE